MDAFYPLFLIHGSTPIINNHEAFVRDKISKRYKKHNTANDKIIKKHSHPGSVHMGEYLHHFILRQVGHGPSKEVFSKNQNKDIPSHGRKASAHNGKAIFPKVCRLF